MLTAGTYQKIHFFAGRDRLDFLTRALFEVAARYGWEFRAWAVFPNHYHWVGLASAEQNNLTRMVRTLHSKTAIRVNALDQQPGRKVWYQYWDSCLTYEKSYYARLNYVHQNPVKHGIVQEATFYPYCSAAWLERNASPQEYRKIRSFGIDRVNVVDGF